jgi:hypothetical protein
MGQNLLINFFGGISLIILGVCIIIDVNNKKKKNHIFLLGSNLTLYFASIASIILGCIFVYKTLF